MSTTITQNFVPVPVFCFAIQDRVKQTGTKKLYYSKILKSYPLIICDNILCINILKFDAFIM